MLAQIPFVPDQAATISSDVDLLIYYITIVTGGVGVLVTIVLIYFCSRYARRREGEETPRILGSHRLELFWTLTPTFIFLTFFAWGVVVYQKGLEPPADSMEVFVVGKQWMWKVQHPSGRREINELHIPAGRNVKVTLISEDVIHSFGIPAFRDKIDVIPGRYVTTWYHPIKVGEYYLFCDQLCGVGHSQMVGTVHVMPGEAYDRWLDGVGNDSDWPTGPTDGSPAFEGRKLFLKLQCVTCHNRGTPESPQRAPLLEGIYNTTVPIRGGGSVRVNADYIRESILRPRAKIHEGWEPIMPSFQGQVTETDIFNLTAFIRSLREGETPTRNTHEPPPLGAPQEPTQAPRPEGGKKE